MQLRLALATCVGASYMKTLKAKFSKSWFPLFIICWLQHVLVRHCPWFIDQWGSLSIWSCQAMEKSHHEAKAAYQRHTQHSGAHGKSALLQTFEHWYRIIGHRLRNKDVLDNEPVVNTDEIEGEIQARRERYFASSAAAHWAEWRTTCTRIGSRWIPNLPSEGNDNQNYHDTNNL